MAVIDLHINSSHSADGELSIAEIIGICVELKVETVSITDHNTVRGQREAEIAGKDRNLRIIPGIEIDCHFEGIDLHLLGYYIDRSAAVFNELESEIIEKVLNTFPRMIDNLKKEGFDIGAEEVLLKAGNRLPCGELVAETLLNSDRHKNNAKLLPYRTGGSRGDMPYINFYHDYFAQGKPAYEKIDYISLREAVLMVKNSGGIPVIAHPGINLKNNENLIDRIIKEGVEGIEVYSGYHDQRQIGFFAEKSIEKKLMMTCGSDFHGKNKPLIKIGDCDPGHHIDYILKGGWKTKN